MIGVDHQTIRRAIDRGRIPMDALELRRSVNGRRSYVISDPKLAAEWWLRSYAGASMTGTADEKFADLPKWAQEMRLRKDVAYVTHVYDRREDIYARHSRREYGTVSRLRVDAALITVEAELIDEAKGHDRRRVRRLTNEFRRRVLAEIAFTQKPPAERTAAEYGLGPAAPSKG
jgi:hypothetical protein